jgi:DNA ligase (NAD+)
VDISSEITSEETRIYQELKSISEEIRRHDDLYYAGKTEISDDDYDALTRREEEICRTMPLLRAKLQQESGIGEQATRLGRVGAKISGRKKRKHLVPMLSLENVTTEGQVLAWLERIRKKLVDAKIAKVTIITEPKLDGVSLSLRYERQHADGIFSFQWASTRGDGKQGQDVTEAVVNGMNIPKTFRCDQATNLPSEIEIRGEVVLPNTAFRLLLESNQTLNTTSFANARNAASGILLRKSSSASKEDDAESNLLRSKLCFNAYDIIGMTQLNEGDQLEMRTKLEAAGFSVPYPFEVTHLTVDNATKWATSDIQPMLNYHCALERHRNRESDNDVISTDKLLEWGDYDMDGAVHKVSDPVLRQLLGTSNRAPRWAVAHKFPATSALTTLHDVLVQVGRTGSLTPVAVLEPVELGGAKIQRATLHNFFYMKQVLGGRGRIPSGCKVLVRRAGDVIPQVVHLVGNESLDDSLASSWISLEPPTTCPACGSPTVLAAPTRNSNSSSSDVGEGETETGQVWRCSGQPLLCPPRAVLALKHAYSRDALDITGLSEARIEQLMEAGFLRFPSDLFRLNATQWEEIANMTGWGVKSATNLKANADRVVQDGVSLSRFIYSLGIRFAGIHSSKLLATAYGSAEAFLSEMTTAAENNGEYGVESVALPTLAGESEATKGVGPVLKNSLVAFAQESELLGAATELHQAILVLDDEDYNVSEQTGIAMPTDSQPLYGMTVVFTGSIEEMSRTEGQKLAKLMGAKSTPNTVTKATSLVVVGDNGGTKKLEKAQDLEVKFMPAKEFLDLANKTIKKP